MTDCFAGLDWASCNHAVCVVDASAAGRDRFDVTHDAAGLRELVARLRRYAPTPAQLPVAIERPSDAQLAAEAGVAPLTYESGKHRSVAFRWACNHRLRCAITCFADNSRHASPWAARVYAAARARGCDHPHAIRILARAWIRMLWRMWVDRRPYDPTRHRAALALNATGG